MDAAQTATADDLTELIGALRDGERCIARAVLLAGRVAGSGVCEAVEGLPLEHFLGLACRLTGADRRTLVAAGEALADLPCVAALFSSGALSWGQVRAVVRQVRRLPRAERAVLDARVAETARRDGGVDAFDPDQLVDAVERAVEELRAPRSVERSARRRVEGSFVAVQAGFDGGLRLYADLDPVLARRCWRVGRGGRAAPPRAARTDRAGRPRAAGAGCRATRATRAARGPGRAGRGGARAGGLVGDCAWAAVRPGAGEGLLRGLSGGSGRPARPLVVVHVDLGQVAVNPVGTVELAVRGPLSRIGAAALDALADDADVRAVLFDGARPLAATGRVHAEDTPSATRRAVAARDLGCRFPGSNDPLGHCDVHHLVERQRGGSHHPDNLAMLSRRHHTLVHRCGWTLTVDPPTGQVTATRRQRRWRSLPRGTGLARAPDPPPDHTDPF